MSGQAPTAATDARGWIAQMGRGLQVRTRAGSRRVGSAVVLLAVLGCTGAEPGMEASRLTPCTGLNFMYEARDPLCSQFCQTSCAPDVADCEDRCDHALWLADGNGEDLGGQPCGERTRAYLACWMGAGCEADEGLGACAGEYADMLDACAGAATFYPGYRVCHEYCDALACSCEDSSSFRDWGDCYGQCVANTGIDQSSGCFGEGVTLRRCIYEEIQTCQDLQSLKDGRPEAPCSQESAAWEAACTAQG